MDATIDTSSQAQAPLAQEAEGKDFETSRVLVVGMGHAVHDTYTAFLAPLLPVFIETMALTKAEAGLLSVFIQVPSLLQPFIGHMSDRFNLLWLFILAPALSAITMSALGIAPGYAALAILLVITGFSSASLHAIGPVIAGTLSGKKLGKGMSFWMVGGELGRTLGPIVIVTAIQLLTLQGTPWLMIAGLLASFLLYLGLRDVPQRVVTIDEQIPWRQALRTMAPLLLPLSGIVIARAFMVTSLTTYLPTFLSDEGADLWFAGASLTVFEVAGVAGAMLGGSLSDRLGRRAILVASMLLSPLLMLIFMTTSGWGRFPMLLALGFTVLSVTPVIMALVQESFPESRALANGIYMSMGFVLRSGVTVTLGLLGDRFGLRTAFTISAVVALLGLPLILALPVKQRAT